ncbi:beta-glucosidase [Microvirga terrae]|uniref:Beta-glucosidase n=1 Tax=Microvirga terrae TaxID=2740529 RepID=A0ABY5RWP4_9HYPH|nr:beta-glucosidase [Microvirga terrae]UVF21670.1 beta-glucosidase [Microvirga terrae]
MISPDNASPFGSFFLGGFECSSHRRWDGRRLDLLASTDHDRLAAQDYELLSEHGIHAARDGLRWHLIETAPGRYDWSSFLPMLRAAEGTGTRVIWDLCHYGYPDDLDIWSPTFIDRFARFASAAARLIKEESRQVPVYCPVNEISYWAWAGGEVGRFNPCGHGRGAELKRQLVRATIAAIAAIRAVDPRARFITAEPLINVEAGLGDDEHARSAHVYQQSQFEALDILCGAKEPELGGAPDCLDMVGLNYYPENQWYLGGSTIPMGHHSYRPLHILLKEAYRRYRRPLLIAETGAEGCGRSSWFHYVCSEVHAAMDVGVPVTGICLYPVADYPGWDNGRTCSVGLLTTADSQGCRTVFPRLARELQQQQALFAAFDGGEDAPVPSIAAE